MTYEELQKVNSEIKTTQIKKKDYAEVPQRIIAFRKLYPEGFIRTTLLSNENGVCVFKAEVGFMLNVNMDDFPYRDTVILGVGHAYEKEDSTFINKTSYIENCETSAVGRALGMAGFGIDTAVASAEEVQNAMANQDKETIKKAQESPNKKISKKQLDSIKKQCDKDGVDEAFICAQMDVATLSDLTYVQYMALTGSWSELIEKSKKELDEMPWVD